MIYKTSHDIISVSGQDRATFLQGQLTQNVVDITKPVLGACCEANGRAVATMMVIPHEAVLLLWLPKGMGAILIEHLKKYAVFSKVELKLTELNSYTSLEPMDHANAILLPGSKARYLLISDDTLESNIDDGTIAKAHIDAGFAQITPATSGKIIPLMLNYIELGGISFNKGCYVGQEIIARMHYKGQMKRRLHRIQCKSPMQSGDDIVNENGQVMGLMINSHGLDALAVIQDRALDGSLGGVDVV